MKNWFFIGLLCLLLTGCGLVQQQKKPLFTPEETAKVDKKIGEVGPTVSDQVETLPITPLEAIRNAFDENPLNAASVYGNKWIKTQGTLVSGPLKDDFLGVSSYSLSLENKGKELRFLFWGSAKEEQMKTLKRGQTVTIVGKFSKNNKQPTISPSIIFAIENPPVK